MRLFEPPIYAGTIVAPVVAARRPTVERHADSATDPSGEETCATSPAGKMMMAPPWRSHRCADLRPLRLRAADADRSNGSTKKQKPRSSGTRDSTRFAIK